MTQDWGVKGEGKEKGKSKTTIIVIMKAKQMYLFARESHSIGVQRLTSLASLQQVIFLKDNNKLH